VGQKKKKKTKTKNKKQKKVENTLLMMDGYKRGRSSSPPLDIRPRKNPKEKEKPPAEKARKVCFVYSI
jgi:hypothetical protein